jgi:hypothetical protein
MPWIQCSSSDRFRTLTRRFNIAQGMIITAQIGAALSTAVAGFVVVAAGYTAAFLVILLIVRPLIVHPFASWRSVGDHLRQK